MPNLNFNTFTVTGDYKTQNKWLPVFSHFCPVFQLSGDDGADCNSDISSLYNPSKGRTDRRKATAAGLGVAD